METTFFKKILDFLKNPFSKLSGHSLKSILSFKGIILIGIIVLVVVFRDMVIDYTIHLTLLILLVVLLLLLYFIIRLLSFIIPFIIHILNKDMLKVGAIHRVRITERIDKSSLLEERLAYGKDEFFALEKYLEETEIPEDKKAEFINLCKKRNEVSVAVSEEISHLKANYRELKIIEKELKKFSMKSELTLTKSLVKSSIHIIVPIGILVLIPFLFYLLYHFLKVLGVFK
jgi:hypothetical protein